jgi:hypothetical protein
MAVFRGVAINSGGTANLSLDANKDPLAVATDHVAVSGVAWNDSNAQASAALVVSGTSAIVSPAVWPPSSTPFAAAPSQLLVASDLYAMSGSASGNFPFHKRRIDRYQHLPSDVALVLPDILEAGAGATTKTPYVRADVSFTPIAGAAVYEGELDQVTRRVELIMTAAWAGAASPVKWLEPDLTGVSGWDDSWALATGVSTTWLATAIATDRDPLSTPDATWDGAVITNTTRFGFTTP